MITRLAAPSAYAAVPLVIARLAAPFAFAAVPVVDVDVLAATSTSSSTAGFALYSTKRRQIMDDLTTPLACASFVANRPGRAFILAKIVDDSATSLALARISNIVPEHQALDSP
jgi:hypothetical protein